MASLYADDTVLLAENEGMLQRTVGEKGSERREGDGGRVGREEGLAWITKAREAGEVTQQRPRPGEPFDTT